MGILGFPGLDKLFFPFALLTVDCSLFTVYCSLFTVHCSLFFIPLNVLPPIIPVEYILQIQKILARVAEPGEEIERRRRLIWMDTKQKTRKRSLNRAYGLESPVLTSQR